jgi:hypothetical protein
MNEKAVKKSSVSGEVKAMGEKNNPMLDEITKLVGVLSVELPTAAAKSLLGNGDREALRQTGWKAYDAWISLANETANGLYSNRVFGEVVGRSIGAALRVQRVVDAAASAVFGNLWPAIGLPTESAVTALRDEVKALRSEVRALGEELRSGEAEDELAAADDYAAARSAEAQNAAAAMIWNGYRPEQPRVRGGRKEGKKSVAL